MAAHEASSSPVGVNGPAAGRAAWLFSLPLLVGIWVYLYSLYQGKRLLLDGDTYWHIATGQWILRNGTIPTADPFSHTMRGVVWTAHEWLSEVILAAAHQIGGWTVVVAVTALAFAATIALLTRALLRWLEPIYALLFAVLAVPMTAGHLLARPHMLAMPLMMIWTIELVRASEANRSPGLWLLPVMTLWANLHGGFTMGIALACAFALEALLTARRAQRVASTARSWGIFLALATASALATPHGIQGFWFTWHIFFELSYALNRIAEWRSPNFNILQPLELWLLGGLALVLHQGLRLPPVRLILLVALLHLALKHIRSMELVGLLGPLILAAPLAAQWRERQQSQHQFDVADRFFRKLSEPAGQGAILASLVVFLALPLWSLRAGPLELPESKAPIHAIRAAQQAGIHGPVLNAYGWGGYLIYAGIPPFIDGRADMYGDKFLQEYLEALELKTSDGLEKLLDKYRIAWTLLDPGSPAVALLDHLPEWRRVYADKTSVVHAKAVK